MRHTDLPHTCDDGDADGDCIPCVAAQEEVKSDCGCGECCRNLIIEVLAEDAIVEPRIKECEPLLDPPDEAGHRDLIGYLLNDSANGGACKFLDRATNRCTIYSSRPLTCRIFDCCGEHRNELVELGILSART